MTERHYFKCTRCKVEKGNYSTDCECCNGTGKIPVSKNCAVCGKLTTKDRWRYNKGERPLCPEHSEPADDYNTF
jgi:RecJ-like exonuclease